MSVALACAVLVACSPANQAPADQGPTGGATGSAASTPSASAEPKGPSALDDRYNPAFTDALIDPTDLIAGGPPPDGIPPLDKPTFESVDEVDWLGPTEPLLALTVDGQTTGYPLQIMTWHEIVNDTVAGVPVAVTYCPLCNSGVAFHREVDGRVLDFGTSGLLYASNLVMYDRQTESLWPQLTGIASLGALTGTKLKAIPMGVVGWDQFASAYPDARVLSRETGFDRDYGRNPYVSYDDPEGRLIALPPNGRDNRLPVKERVIGVGAGADAIAVRRDALADGPVALEASGRPLVLWRVPGQASALDRPEIKDGKDIGTVGVFSARLGGRLLTFRAAGAGFVDEQTGSTWTALGRATRGPLAGRRLRTVQHLDTFWFAWVAFQPETTIHG
ncbi:MAG: DUF3179 domain-containing protein, partial [Nocardioides sp.]